MLKLELTERENQIVFQAMRDFVKTNQGKISAKELQPYVQIHGDIENDGFFYLETMFAIPFCHRLLGFAEGAETDAEAREIVSLVNKICDLFGYSHMAKN